VAVSFIDGGRKPPTIMHAYKKRTSQMTSRRPSSLDYQYKRKLSNNVYGGRGSRGRDSMVVELITTHAIGHS
jgi:hypothetical protein